MSCSHRRQRVLGIDFSQVVHCIIYCGFLHCPSISLISWEVVYSCTCTTHSTALSSWNGIRIQLTKETKRNKTLCAAYMGIEIETRERKVFNLQLLDTCVGVFLFIYKIDARFLDPTAWVSIALYKPSGVEAGRFWGFVWCLVDALGGLLLLIY
jgi:hypothetical protein